jgi:uncharacterized protein
MLIFAFEVKPSPIDGKGLFAKSFIPARKKFGELKGERISHREGRRRAKQTKRIMIVEFDDGTSIDAANGGNEFSYVNHSCSPNSYMRIIGSRVEFYALRDIAKGEEITCNYGESHHHGTLPCGCGSENCKTRL